MRWRILPLVLLFVALAHFNRLSISVAGAEQLIPHEGIGETEMGAVYSTLLLVYTLFMIPGGWFADRFGPWAAWMVLAFGSAVFVTLTGVAGMIFEGGTALLLALLAVRAALGLAFAPLHPTGARLVANWVPPSGAALANGLITGAACVGIASVYVVFGFLIDEVGWRWAFVVTGGITLAVALAWTAAGADYPAGLPPPRRERPGLASVGRLLGNRSLLLLTLSYGAFGYFQYFFFYWAQYYFTTEMHLSKQESRDNSSCLTLAMGAGMVLGGWLSDRAQASFGPRRGLAVVPVTGLTVGAAATFAGLFLQDATAILLAFTVAMAATGTCEGPSWTAAVRIGRRSGATAAGVMNTGGNALGLLSPVLGPWISEKFGWPAALGLAGLFCLLGAALWLSVDPTGVPDEAPARQEVLS
jgi:MFS family permease